MSTTTEPSGTETSSQPYAELAELAGRLTHEIKNHLSTLSLNLQLLTEELRPGESPRERRALQRAQKLQRECKRLVDLSNDFLRYAQVRDLRLEPTDIKDVIEELLDFYGPSAAHARIDIDTFVPSDLPLVNLDRELFKRALLNLILNAQHAMPDGGQLTIQAEKADGVILSLIDTGVGMPPEIQAKIFRPFFTTRSEGSGLGLPTARRIIEAHGGRIEVESEPGRGTKFTIYLPAATTDSAPHQP